MPTNNKFTGSSLVPFVAVSVLCAGHANAGPQSTSEQGEALDEIVVVANKSERSVREIAANVTVVSRQDLSDILATSAADVFRYSPGIDYEASG